MTGGQAAPTTLIGQKSTTTPLGRSAANEGYPLRMSELLATLEAPVYIERVGLGDNKQIAQATRAIRRAVENQVRGLGFSLIEVLSPCPTIWKMSAVESQHWVRDVMEKTYPLGVVCDRTKDAHPRSRRDIRPALEEIPAILGIVHDDQPRQCRAACTQSEARRPACARRRIRRAGRSAARRSAGRGGLDAGLEVSWLPSYGPEMRSGTSNCHVRVSKEPIDSPLVTVPDISRRHE